jgi:hypothetical protein
MAETGFMTRVFRRAGWLFFLVFFCFATPSTGQKSKSPEGMAYGSFPGQPAPSIERLGTLLRQIRWDTRRAGDENPDGLRLRFEKIDAAGTTAAPVRYRVFAEGAPENKVYRLGVWVIGKELAYRTESIYVNGQGLILQHRPTAHEETSFKAPGEELVLMPETGNAEPVRYVLSSLDGELSIQGTLVPHPDVGRDGECMVEARMAEPGAAAILIVADAFPAEARLSLVLESEGKTTHLDLTTDESGHAEVADFPTVPGKAQGTLTITAEGTDCLPSVRLGWGTAPAAAGKAP